MNLLFLLPHTIQEIGHPLAQCVVSPGLDNGSAGWWDNFKHQGQVRDVPRNVGHLRGRVRGLLILSGLLIS